MYIVNMYRIDSVSRSVHIKYLICEGVSDSIPEKEETHMSVTLLAGAKAFATKVLTSTATSNVLGGAILGGVTYGNVKLSKIDDRTKGIKSDLSEFKNGQQNILDDIDAMRCEMHDGFAGDNCYIDDEGNVHQWLSRYRNQNGMPAGNDGGSNPPANGNGNGSNNNADMMQFMQNFMNQQAEQNQKFLNSMTSMMTNAFNGANNANAGGNAGAPGASQT
jgi:hypothetical protein